MVEEGEGREVEKGVGFRCGIGDPAHSTVCHLVVVVVVVVIPHIYMGCRVYIDREGYRLATGRCVEMNDRPTTFHHPHGG